MVAKCFCIVMFDPILTHKRWLPTYCFVKLGCYVRAFPGEKVKLYAQLKFILFLFDLLSLPPQPICCKRNYTKIFTEKRKFRKKFMH